MRRLGWMWAAAVAVCCVAAVGRADEPVVGGEAFFAYNTYRMKQVNQEFGLINSFGASEFSKIDHGITGGFGVRFWMTPSWLITAAWEPLYGQTQSAVALEDSATGTPFTVDIRYNVDGKSVQLGTAYVFPSERAIRLGLGAGLGYYWVRGEVVVNHQSDTSVEDLQGSAQIRGSTVGLQAGGLAEWTVNPGVGVTAWAGYRLAKVGDTRVEGERTSPKTETDYSGFMGRLGVVFYLPQRQ